MWWWMCVWTMCIMEVKRGFVVLQYVGKGGGGVHWRVCGEIVMMGIESNCWRGIFFVCPVPMCDNNNGGVIQVRLLHDFIPFDDFRDEVDVNDVGVSVARPLCVEGMFRLFCVLNDIA